MTHVFEDDYVFSTVEELNDVADLADRYGVPALMELIKEKVAEKKIPEEGVMEAARLVEFHVSRGGGLIRNNDESETKLKKPQFPVMFLNSRMLEKWFPQLIRYLILIL